MFSRILFATIIFFLLSCLDHSKMQSSEDKTTRYTEKSTEEKITDSKDDTKTTTTSRDTSRTTSRTTTRDNTRSRLRNKDNIRLETELESRYRGSSNRSYNDYGDDECSEDRSCEILCERIITSSSQRKSCEKLPYDLVAEIEESLITLRNIKDPQQSVGIDPDVFSAILDINENIIIKIVEKMNIEGVKNFLAWVAINEDVMEVLDEEDSSGKILKEAFSVLAGGDSKIANAFKVPLLGNEDTFFYLAADEGNEKALVAGYDLFDKACDKKGTTSKSIECKKEVMCAREYRSASTRSRLYRSQGRSRTRNGNQCRTSITNTNRRSSSASTCYLQGETVWEYLLDLIDNGDIKDADLEKDLSDKKINVDYCNKFCGTETKDNEGKCNFSVD